MGTTHGAEELRLCPHGLACHAGAKGRHIGFYQVYGHIYIRGKILWIESGKIFCEAHNFVQWWNFDERFVACRAWGAGDADRGIARVNRATRARAIGTYLRRLFISDHL